MRRLFVIALIAILLIPTVTAAPNAPQDQHTVEMFPIHPEINVTRVITLEDGFLANASDHFIINATEPFNAFRFALPSFVFDLSVQADNLSTSLSVGPTFVVNGTEMKRITIEFQENVTMANFTVFYYFMNVQINDTREGNTPEDYNAYAILRFTTVPISEYEYRYVTLNVTFPTEATPKSEFSKPSGASVNLNTLTREFENVTGTSPGLDLLAISEVSKLPFEVTKAEGTYQFTSGSEVYVEWDLTVRLTGNYEYDGPYTNDEPKTAIRFIYVYLPKTIDEIKVYDDLGIVINVTKYPRENYYRREIKTRTPLVGEIEDYHLKILYKLDVSMGVKIELDTVTPLIPAIIREMHIRVISPPFGYISGIDRITKPSGHYETGSRHMPVHVVDAYAYNITHSYTLHIVAFRSLMSYLGMPIVGSILTFISAIVTLALIRLVPPTEEEEKAKTLPDDVRRAMTILEEVAGIAPTIIALLEKSMRPEERIRALENIRAKAEAKLKEAIAAINAVKDKDSREVLIAAAGIGASIVSAIRRLEEIERLRPTVTRAIYEASLAEAGAFIDSSYKRMISILTSLKL